MGKDGPAQKIVDRVVGRKRRHVLDEPRELIRRRLYRVLLGVLSIRRADFGIVRVEVNARARYVEVIGA